MEWGGMLNGSDICEWLGIVILIIGVRWVF